MIGKYNTPRMTVLGARGFIGSHLLERLRKSGFDCYVPGRNEPLADKQLGTVFYCIGLTADFRSRPFETVEAHISLLSRILEHASFDRLVYLSSSRIYKSGYDIAREENDLQVNPADPSDLYNLSKAMGEAIALSSRRNVAIVRLSNVYGDDFTSGNFLASILRDALDHGHVMLRTTLTSTKDYISVDDVTRMLVAIGLNGRDRTYNVASGTNTSNAQLAEVISRLTGCRFNVAADSLEIIFPRISVERLATEFEFVASDVLSDIVLLTERYRQRERITSPLVHPAAHNHSGMYNENV